MTELQKKVKKVYVQETIGKHLWETYEYACPDSPNMMAKRIVELLLVATPELFTSPVDAVGNADDHA